MSDVKTVADLVALLQTMKQDTPVQYVVFTNEEDLVRCLINYVKGES